MQKAVETYKETYFHRVWKPFFSNTGNWFIFFGTLVLLLLIFFACFYKRDLVIYPDNAEFGYVIYDDSANLGHSRVIDYTQTDSSLRIRFVLHEGFINPYVGVRYFPDNPAQELDISDYNQMAVKVSGSPISHLILYLITADHQVKDSLHRLAHRHSGTGIKVSPQPETVTIPFNLFQTPDWWYEEIDQLPYEFSSPALQHFKGIAITTGIKAELNTPHQLEVHAIVLQKNNTTAWYILSAVQGLILIFLLLKHYSTLRQKERTIIVSYKPVVVYTNKPDQTKSFLDYIHTHFADPELSLKTVSKNSGVHQRVITETIASRFHCNFKTYINQIRIKEAQRLLKESELNISEIAYQVGFNSPSNFNRVFKNLTGKNPTEFIREK